MRPQELDGPSGIPMSQRMERAIERLAEEAGVELTIDWQDMDMKQGRAMIAGLIADRAAHRVGARRALISTRDPVDVRQR